jgi:uncharacterized heparinase superfamily protein
VLRTSHDGYAELFNVVHHRVIMLAPDGQKLDGEDTFVPAKGETFPAGRDLFAVRFHLHPSVRASRLADGRSAMLVMANKDVWTFEAYEDEVEIEESVYLAGNDGPRRTLQIVIYGEARKVLRVQWTLSVAAAAPAATATPAAARRARDDEPQLPLESP